MCDIFDEVKRVLRKDGVCFVNIGDSYGGSGNASGHNKDTKNLGYKTLEMGATQGNQKATGQYAKSLLDIPYHFSIEMTNRDWIKRNTIIWWKLNCMPSSANDRFTIDFEYLFFFTKNNKAIFWTNEKTLECVDKKPLGIKGIEGKDWEWRKCPNCEGTGKAKINIKDRLEIYGENDPAGMHRGRMRDFLDKKKDMYQAGDKPYKLCKGSGKIKVSFWSGHDYWFEQQFKQYKPSSFERMHYPLYGEGSKGKNGKYSISPDAEYKQNPQGRNERCVWIIPTQPFPEAHFAVYPEGLIEIPIKAGCPEFVCKKCGKARVKIYEYIYKGPIMIDAETKHGKLLGYSDCGCNAGWESGVVCNPFMGAGTTALVALKQRKRFIGIEIKQEYIDMAKRRIAKVQQRIF